MKNMTQVYEGQSLQIPFGEYLLSLLYMSIVNICKDLLSLCFFCLKNFKEIWREHSKLCEKIATYDKNEESVACLRHLGD